MDASFVATQRPVWAARTRRAGPRRPHRAVLMRLTLSRRLNEGTRAGPVHLRRTGSALGRKWAGGTSARFGAFFQDWTRPRQMAGLRGVEVCRRLVPGNTEELARADAPWSRCSGPPPRREAGPAKGFGRRGLGPRRRDCSYRRVGPVTPTTATPGRPERSCPGPSPAASLARDVLTVLYQASAAPGSAGKCRGRPGPVPRRCTSSCLHQRAPLPLSPPWTGTNSAPAESAASRGGAGPGRAARGGEAARPGVTRRLGRVAFAVAVANARAQEEAPDRKTTRSPGGLPEVFLPSLTTCGKTGRRRRPRRGPERAGEAAGGRQLVCPAGWGHAALRSADRNGLSPTGFLLPGNRKVRRDGPHVRRERTSSSRGPQAQADDRPVRAAGKFARRGSPAGRQLKAATSRPVAVLRSPRRPVRRGRVAGPAGAADRDDDFDSGPWMPEAGFDEPPRGLHHPRRTGSSRSQRSRAAARWPRARAGRRVAVSTLGSERVRVRGGGRPFCCRATERKLPALLVASEARRALPPSAPRAGRPARRLLERCILACSAARNGVTAGRYDDTSVAAPVPIGLRRRSRARMSRRPSGPTAPRSQARPVNANAGPACRRGGGGRRGSAFATDLHRMGRPGGRLVGMSAKSLSLLLTAKASCPGSDRR